MNHLEYFPKETTLPDWHGKPYYSLDSYLKNEYGEKVYKIALDAGFTCPNRDGTISHGGCVFCSAGGSGEHAVSTVGKSIQDQIEEGLKLFHNKKIGNKFIAYFQAYTNTYAPVSTLRPLYEEALKHEQVVGISIATRPDCLPDEVLQLLVALKEQYPGKFIWIELGLQTIHEKTATLIRRGYPLHTFENALTRLNDCGIPTIVHVILGLPGESKEDILATINYLNQAGIWGIKLQLLHVLKDTDLANWYEAGVFEVYNLEEYLHILTECIAQLNKNIIIHRVTGDGPKDLLIAPDFSRNKRLVLNSLHKELKQKGITQGGHK
ncbi:MAG: TIGR01212 family radical SAM protein [Lachnospiraceae bacterium]|nr:TIGR01212 family radical SAM protein [Lachnospiraceae bacterium]